MYDILLNYSLNEKYFGQNLYMESKHAVYFSWLFSPEKSYRLWDKVEKLRRPGQPMDENLIRCLRFACWITKVTNTHSEYIIGYLLLFHGNNGYVNAPQCYVCTSVLRMRALPVLLRSALLWRFVWRRSKRT